MTVTFKATVTLLILTSCAPAVVSAPTQILPAPLVQITHAAPTSTASPAPTSAPPAQIPIPRSDPEKLAEELYGTRTIQRISIPALDVESEVLPVGWRIHYSADLQSGAFEWDSPGAKAGWVITSALPDESTGNIVMYGHNNTYEKLFINLSALTEGRKIYLQTSERRWEYQVRYNLLLPILGADAAQIKSYQQYLQPTQDARLTLISCWPPISNTHRVVIIAKRIDD